MKILILGGGESPERDVSLKSAAAVVMMATELGHDVIQLDPRDEHGKLAAAVAKSDVVLPILHGAGGEDGVIQELIEHAGIPYLGSDAAASRLCFDKVDYKTALKAHDILTPAYAEVTKQEFLASPLTHRPYVLKPVDGGSSLDTFIVRQPDARSPDIMAAFDRYPTMLLEELIEGTEITVAILDKQALPVIEIIPPQGQEFDFDNKYNGTTQELCPAQNVDHVDQEQARQLAQMIHQLTGCRHLSRTDMIITPMHAIYALETNTMPGMTAQSLYPKAALASGLDWDKLVEQLISLATIA